MAPEQIAHPSDVDHRADIYALGVVFYQMLTGELPGKELQAPSKKVHIDVRLDEIVLRAMEKDPERRYQRASVMRTRVDDLETQPAEAPKSPPASVAVAKNDSYAIASFAFGIGSLVLWPLGFLPAIVLGHLSRSRIKRNPALTGRGFATTGLVLGYVFLSIFVTLPVVLYGYFSLAMAPETELPREAPSIHGIAYKADEQGAPQEPRKAMIELLPGDTVKWNGERISWPTLADELTKIIHESPDAEVTIRSSPEVPNSKVNEIVDRCQKLGIWNLLFATENPPSR